MEYLRKFETENEYLEAKDSFVFPNVSYVVDVDIVYYMNSSNYEFVDLGLPSGLKWATCNIGATKPEESGLYFAWGEDKGYIVTKGDVQYEPNGMYTAVITNADGSETTKAFKSDRSDYKFPNWDKYNATDNLIRLELEDDGCYLTEKTMRMPTQNECYELIEGTTSAWTSDYNGSGIAGVTLTSKNNGNSIFVPALGRVTNEELDTFGLYGYFWSSSRSSDIVEEASYLIFNESILGTEIGYRFGGYPLRAVSL